MILSLQREPPSITQHPPYMWGLGVVPTTLLPLAPSSPPSPPSTTLLVTSTPSSYLCMHWSPIISLISPSRLSLLFLHPLFPISSFVLNDLFPLFLHTAFPVFCCRPPVDPSRIQTTFLSNNVFFSHLYMLNEACHCVFVIQMNVWKCKRLQNDICKVWYAVILLVS